MTGEYCIRIKTRIFEGSDCHHCSSLMSTFSTNQLDLRRQKCIHLLQLESSAWELVWSHISLSLESCTHLIVSDQCDWKLIWMLRCFLGFHFPVIISTGQWSVDKVSEACGQKPNCNSRFSGLMQLELSTWLLQLSISPGHIMIIAMASWSLNKVSGRCRAKHVEIWCNLRFPWLLQLSRISLSLYSCPDKSPLTSVGKSKNVEMWIT